MDPTKYRSDFSYYNHLDFKNFQKNFFIDLAFAITKPWSAQETTSICKSKHVRIAIAIVAFVISLGIITIIAQLCITRTMKGHLDRQHIEKKKKIQANHRWGALHFIQKFAVKANKT